MKWENTDGTDGTPEALQGVRTLQGEVEKALSLVFRVEVRTVGASRTDSGVHARGSSAEWLDTPMRVVS